MQFGRYYEEFEVGATYKHWPGKTVTEYDDHLFCLLTMNHHPLHLDAHYAEETTEFGKNVVVGNYIYSLLLGMSVPDVSGKAIANLEVESLKHVAPTFHGDTIYGETTVLDKTESKSKDDRGVVHVETKGYNQDGTRRVRLPAQGDGAQAVVRRRARRRAARAGPSRPLDLGRRSVNPPVMRPEPVCPRCLERVDPPGLRSSAWVCHEHGEVYPFHRRTLAPTAESVDWLVARAGVPVWVPWPLPPGWLVTGTAHAGDERTGARATVVALSGPAPLGGAGELLLVAEEPGIGLGARIAGLQAPNRGRLSKQNPPARPGLRRGGPPTALEVPSRRAGLPRTVNLPACEWGGISWL